MSLKDKLSGDKPDPLGLISPERMAELRESLAHHGRHVLDAREAIGDTLDRAYELLRMRRVTRSRA